MAQELAIHGGGGVDKPSAPGRKGLQLQVRPDRFAVRREVFAVSEMSVPARRFLGKRLVSELYAVRDLLRKAEFYSRSAGAPGAAAPAGKDGGRLLASEAPVEDDGCRAAKRRKMSPFEEKRMTPDDRERLAGRLASLAALLPDHVVTFLQNQRVGDADSRGGGGEIEMDVQSMKDGALFQLKMLLDKLAPLSTPKCDGRAPLVASGVSCLSTSQHPGGGDKMAPVQEEEGVDICGGVSRIEIRDIGEEYGELVEDIGVELLSPLPRKYVDLVEQGEYIDICGDASPVVFPAKAGDCSSSPDLSSSDSDASSADSDSSSSSGRDSESGPDASRRSRPQPPEPEVEALQISDPELQNKCAPPTPTVFMITSKPTVSAVLSKENGIYAQPPEPAAETAPIAEPDELQDQGVPPTSTVHLVKRSTREPPVLPKENNTYKQQSEPAPEAMQIAEPENQCAPLAPTVLPITGSLSAVAVLPKESGTIAPPTEQAPEAVKIAEPEGPQDKCVAPAATVHPITGNAPPPAVVPKENSSSSQPPVGAQIAGPDELPDQGAAHGPTSMANLITWAQVAAERRRQDDKERGRGKVQEEERTKAKAQEEEEGRVKAQKERAKTKVQGENESARAKARQELLEMERAALPDERIHPLDMELLGITAFEHVVSTVRDARTGQAQVNDVVAFRVLPGRPSILQQLGFFLKAEHGGEEEQQQPETDDGAGEQRPLLGFASDGEDMEIEDGEIR